MKALDGLKEKMILARARIGDKDAFAEVYDFYVIKIFRFIYLKTSSKETAEDITSEVFLRSWKYLSGTEVDGETLKFDKVGPLLYKIARNLVIDFYRKKKSQNLVEIDETLRNNLPDYNQDIIADISLKQEIEILKKSLEKLKDEYREIIILRHVEDLSMPEIAEITGKSEGTVRVLLHRAIKSLTKAMSEGK